MVLIWFACYEYISIVWHVRGWKTDKIASTPASNRMLMSSIATSPTNHGAIKVYLLMLLDSGQQHEQQISQRHHMTLSQLVSAIQKVVTHIR